MESHHGVLLAVLLVAAVGAYAIIASPGSTGMATAPYDCAAAGGYWYSPYGCMMTQHLCRSTGGMWRVRDNQCVNYNRVKVCELGGGTWNKLSQMCITGIIGE